VTGPEPITTDPAPEPQRQRPTWWLSRFLFLRLLGLIYGVAFLCLANDVLPLLGSEGLLPADSYASWVQERVGGPWQAITKSPSLFHLVISDGLLQGLAWLGVGLSALLLLGFANVPLLASLWALYFSYVSIGQRWFQFGWESQLLETGLLAVFLVPLLDPRPLPQRYPPPRVIIWLGWWLVFRIMLGAGLIKLRGDPCWQELTCLDFHFETQPVPGPLSRWFHELPQPILHAGVLGNHLAELILPFFLIGPRRLRHLAAAGLIAFQCTLIASGNLSFLNWLTLLPCLLCFDDKALARLLPRKLVAEAGRRADSAARIPRAGRAAVLLYAAAVIWLSVPVVTNLMSNSQSMNRSFQALRVVNTYGAFGSVGDTRWEIVLEGTRDSQLGPETKWREYAFKCKPGPLDRRPCLITPYHYRLDWLAWFAGLESARGQGVRREGWLPHLVWKLLQGDDLAIQLLDSNPFPDDPPTWIRVQRYTYEFAPSGNPEGLWWQRELVGAHLPPLSTDDPALLNFLRQNGFFR